MKLALLALEATVCFAQSTTQTWTNGSLAAGTVAANAGSGQPFGAKIVTGRPFTAEAIFETDQTLADGSHVVTQQTLTAARDRQGRTYREEILATPTSGSSAVKAIYTDPVAQVNYFLGPDHVAHKIPMIMVSAQPYAATVSTSNAPATLSLQRFTTATGGGSGPVQAGAQTAQAVQRIALGQVNIEPLNTQVIAVARLRALQRR